MSVGYVKLLFFYGNPLLECCTMVSMVVRLRVTDQTRAELKQEGYWQERSDPGGYGVVVISVCQGTSVVVQKLASFSRAEASGEFLSSHQTRSIELLALFRIRSSRGRFCEMRRVSDSEYQTRVTI